MIRKTKVVRGGQAKTHIRVVEGYRPGPGKPTKHRTIKSFGYLEDHPDPKTFMEEVTRYNKTHLEEKPPPRLEVAGTTRMYSEGNRRYNYGYKYLETLYDQLDIDGFVEKWTKAQRYREAEYPLGRLLKFMVLNRVLKPDSKRATFQMKENYYGMETEFELADVYRSLDAISGMEVELQKHLNEMVKKTIGRDLSHAFYDVTNYYFEIDYPEGEEDLRRRGVSKEHRVDPIAAMGLFIDGNGLPVSMGIFPGNTSESLTLQPTMSEVKKSYGLGRIVVVADKGLNTSDNIDKVANAGDGYVFSQIVKGTKGQRYHGKLFDPSGWAANREGTYRHKTFEEDHAGKDSNGKPVTRRRKVLLYWSEAEAEMARRKREEKLLKAAKSVKNSAYGIKKGVDEYTKEHIVDPGTGELLEGARKIRSVDTEKAERDARYDGYFCIVTSELDYDEAKMREVYGGLWKIEQSFRILKSDLYARPVFVRKTQRIRAHFLICFVALLLVRIVQHRMGKDAISAERIARALNAANCRILKGGIVHLDDVGGAIAFAKRLDKRGKSVDTLQYTDQDEIALDYRLVQNLFGTNCYNIYQRRELFDKFLDSIVLNFS